jgi:patatin-like phospholipase/acyl hydrolase
VPEPMRILSIDGGGIRGVIPAIVLKEIEERTGMPICRLFDLIVGTSTGGIIALGLTRPDGNGEPANSAAEILDLYAEEGGRIFSRTIWHRARAFGNAIEEKFPAGPLEEVLREYLGDARLRDALTDVLVTAYEIERRTPWFFRSRTAQEDAAYDFEMTKVARATSAAPTYFEPLKLETEGTVDYWTLVDGGVFANNPAMCGVAEAMGTYGRDDLIVVSLGTGELTRRIAYEEARDWGLLGWARPILDVVFDGVSDTVDYQVKQLCESKEGVRRYHRFQATLDIGKDDMDDASATNIHALKLVGQGLVEKRGSDLDELCESLASAVGQAQAG